MPSIQEIVPNSFRSQIANDYRQPVTYLNSQLDGTKYGNKLNTHRRHIEKPKHHYGHVKLEDVTNVRNSHKLDSLGHQNTINMA